MKEEALKLADELQDYMTSLGWKTHQASAMIRRLVEELDKQSKPVGVYDGKSLHIYTPQTKPLSDEEIDNLCVKVCVTDRNQIIARFARAIEERHGIK